MREITEVVELCGRDGRLNPAAVGWSRTPSHRCALPGWGRNKRWEYWCVTTPTHLVALTVSDLDYLAVNAVYFLEYGGREVSRAVTVPFGRGVRLPASLGDHDVLVEGPVRIELRYGPEGTRLLASCPAEGFAADLLVRLPEGHETLGVVVPWSGRRFQYTSKQTALPATGTVRIGAAEYAFGDDAWAVLDHGRGRWPYDVTWNWGAASGRTDGRVVGLQLGGKWTDGTGATENALCVDGRLTVVGTELDWRYDPSDLLAPWTIRTPASDEVDLTFTPFHDRYDRTDLKVLRNITHQCFGRYDGTVRAEDGPVRVNDLLGWAEQVQMRW